MWITKPIIAFISGAIFVISVLLTAIGTAVLLAIDIPQIAIFSDGEIIKIIIVTTVILLFSACVFTFQRFAQVQDLKIKLDNRRGLQKKIDYLAQLRSQAINQIYAKTPDPDKFEAWEKEYTSWQKEVQKYLEENFPFAVVEMFTDLGTITPMTFLQASSDQRIQSKHIKILQMLVKELTIIERLILENTVLTIESPINLLELIKWQEQA
ncbi:MAG: hypothetical protein K8R40_00660 [Anaerolineaceae bacterium]|nr:hypothetical protein [Anaerolineaceae bacterium]